MIDYNSLQLQFLMGDYQWKIGEERRVPEVDDLEKVVDRAIDSLYSEPDGAQLEVGHLIIKRRTQDLYDVFVHIGTIGETNE